MNLYTQLSKPILEAVYELNRRQGLLSNIDATINAVYDINSEHERALVSAKIEANFTISLMPISQKTGIIKSCELLINDITLNNFIKPSAPIRTYTQMLLHLIMQSKPEEYDSAMKSASLVEYISEKKGDEGLLLWCHFCIEDLCRSIGTRVLNEV